MLNQVHKIAGEGFTDDPTNSFTPDADYYFDEGIYDAEIRSIFGRNWLYFCHQSQIPNAGDYIVGDVAGQSVYVIRSKEDAVLGFFNVCQHRAHQLLKGSGNVRSVMRCPYHSWTYDIEGNLRGAPKAECVAGFSKDAVKLSPIGVEVVGGFVFVNLDAGAARLSEAVPHFGRKLLEMCPESPQLRYATRQDFEIKANWKVVVENFLENYHSFFSGPAHGQLSDIIDQNTYAWTIDGKVIEFLGKGGTAEKLPYALHEDRRFSGRDLGFQIVYLWPNVAFLLLPGANMMLVFLVNPTGPETTAEPLLYFGLEENMDRGTAAAVDWFSNQLGPEDVDLVESVQHGLHSKGYKRGRLMVDPAQAEAWSEHFIHHFNMQNIKALQDGT